MFLGPQRPFDELAVTLRAAEAGIPVADILGALSLRVCGPLYRHYLVSRELTDCCDLPAWFQESDARQMKTVRPWRAVLPIGSGTCMTAVCIMADLNLKNILVSRTDVQQLFIIDWDKSTHRPGALGPDERQRNVVRFCRSAEKLRPARYPCS